MSSILNSVKKMIGLLPEQKDFDMDLIFHINSAFSVLNQLGVGPSKTFLITGEEETFSDFEEDSRKYPELAMYLFYKVKIGFDPSSVGSTTLSTIKEEIAELEWRMMVKSEVSGVMEEEYVDSIKNIDNQDIENTFSSIIRGDL